MYVGPWVSVIISVEPSTTMAVAEEALRDYGLTVTSREGYAHGEMIGLAPVIHLKTIRALNYIRHFEVIVAATGSNDSVEE